MATAETSTGPTDVTQSGFLASLWATPAGDWIAIGLAFLAIIVSVGVTYYFSTRYERTREARLQKKAQRAVVTDGAAPTMPFAARGIEHYLHEIEHTLQALRQIPDARKGVVADTLRDLIGKLKKTHETLIKSMNFLVSDRISGDFNDTLQGSKDTLYALLTSDKALSEARTHCHAVRNAAWVFKNRLAEEEKARPDLTPIPTAVSSALCSLGNAMERADQDIIVPGMQMLLAAAWQYVEAIDVLLAAGQPKAARALRILAGKRLRGLHANLSEALRQMDEFAAMLDRRPFAASSRSAAQ